MVLIDSGECVFSLTLAVTERDAAYLPHAYPLSLRMATPRCSRQYFSLQVSYNAAGVLAHIASDGETSWTVERPLRVNVLGRIATAIQRWDINAERNINYRSFEPILSLLQAFHTPECQHWAAWALANLTTVYRKLQSLFVTGNPAVILLFKVRVSGRHFFAEVL